MDIKSSYYKNNILFMQRIRYEEQNSSQNRENNPEISESKTRKNRHSNEIEPSNKYIIRLALPQFNPSGGNFSQRPWT